jgi:hypothetical protein
MKITVNLPDDLVEFLGVDSRLPIKGQDEFDIAYRSAFSDVECTVATIETLVRFYATGKIPGFTPKDGRLYEYPKD